jgi:UDPglucose--hexose-1-phosphate uridylyltransferase
MFAVSEVATDKGILQHRREHLTGFRCRISPERLNRHIDQALFLPDSSDGCPFCRDRIFSVTPTFADSTRIILGESVTFPNLFPFGDWHTVTVITEEHTVDTFTHRQVADALRGQVVSLKKFDGYPSINWNFLPSAGASLVHPHMQGISDRAPPLVIERYRSACEQYRKKTGNNYWDAVREQEQASDRYLFGDEIIWSAHAVPLGEREVRGILPITSLDELENYVDLLAQEILEVLTLYKKLGTHAFNMAIFFDKKDVGCDARAFCSLISRINPNPSSTSDSAFMERLHLEPVIMTLPEDLGKFYKKEKN